LLKGEEESYEFRKLAKHEVKEKRYVAKWSDNGRFFVIHGVKSSMFDKTNKSIKIYNMFGELLQ
jgi:hypothetical protein